MYICLETGEVITRKELEDRHRDPLVMFPLEVVDEVLEEFGYANVEFRPMPECHSGQTVERGDVDKDEHGYFYTWIVKDRKIDQSEVDTERDRRVDSGVMFEGNMYQSRPGDRENITGAAQLAMMAIMGGAERGDYRWTNADVDFEWITADNSVVKLDAYQTFDLGKAAAARKQDLIFKARALKDMNPIPADFTADEWWD